jgi:hypothetical protein
MTKAERDLLLLVANWLAMTMVHRGCVPHHLVDAVKCVRSEGRRKAHPNTAILLARSAEPAARARGREAPVSKLNPRATPLAQ